MAIEVPQIKGITERRKGIGSAILRKRANREMNESEEESFR